MSSILLILIKICREYGDIDIRAIERVGIKSLNFSKAILLLEELIISKGIPLNSNKVRNLNSDNGIDKNKEWICLKRLHEASGKN
jgi:hypothetical protein